MNFALSAARKWGQKWGQGANIDRMQERISKKRVLRPLAEKRVLEPWKKIVNFTTDEWFPSRLSFGKGEFMVKAKKLRF